MLRNLRRHRRGRIRAFAAVLAVGGLGLYGLSTVVEQVSDVVAASLDEADASSAAGASITGTFESRIEAITLPPAARTMLAPATAGAVTQLAEPASMVAETAPASAAPPAEAGASGTGVAADARMPVRDDDADPSAVESAVVEPSTRSFALRLPQQAKLVGTDGTSAATVPTTGSAPARTGTATPSAASLAIGFGPGRAGAAPQADAPAPVPVPGTATTVDERRPRAPDLRTLSIRIKPGDSLYSILLARGISGATIPALVSGGDHGKRLKRIRPGESLDLHVDATGELQRVDYRPDVLTTVSYMRDSEGFDSKVIRAPLERRKAQVTGVIRTSLFMDGQRAGLSDRVVMQMAAIFGWDVDFALDLRVGDRFTVVYEELFLHGRKVRDGEILAAEFVNQRDTYRAVRFVAPDQEASYYTPEGLSMRKAFLRTPVKFARISSRFNLKRRHPILHKLRAHKGVDYAAPTGTPVKATGDGRVELLGRKGGYGKTVVIRHGSGYSTLYAHLSSFAKGLKQGATVRQGQTIGHVGKTGLATGPHLHYEFRSKGRHKDPLRVKLPKALPIEARLRRAFREQTHKLVAMLDVYSSASVAIALR